MFARKIVGATSGILLWHAPKTPVELMAGGDDILKGHLRQALMEQAQTGTTTTYRELAQRLGLEPPHTIHRVTEALEWLMEDDVAAGRPILSAICVSKTRPNIPARGFFLAAQGLGIYSGDPSGPRAHAFHTCELQRALSFYGTLRDDCQDRDRTQKETMGFFERLKAKASAEWRAYSEHPFTNGMADGSLPEAAFRYYLIQDYLFLIEFARAYALSIYKSPTLADMREGAAGLSAVLEVEMNLHVRLCTGWGLSPVDLEEASPAAEMLAYTRYVLDTGMRGDLLALKVALAPCVLGYAEIAARLAARPDACAATNPYRTWTAEYAGAAYQEVAAKARGHLDRLAERYVTATREVELIAIFREATRLETAFWEMGWRAGQRVEQ